jgi:type IV pilus assembly protein PilP
MKIIFFTALLFLTQFVWAQTGSDIFKNKTKIKEPFKLRDPFKPKEVRGQKGQKGSGGSGGMRNGIFTNLDGIENVPLAQIKITGVVIGKDRRALAKIADGKPGIILREGMKIGEDQAEIKAILPGGIVLVEKIINVYGQEEYLETVIPISK